MHDEKKKMAIELDSGFTIVRFSDATHKQITVEIQDRGEQIAQINRDKGNDKFEIEIFTDYIESNFYPKFMSNDFQQALNEARILEKG